MPWLKSLFNSNGKSGEKDREDKKRKQVKQGETIPEVIKNVFKN